VPSLVSGRNYRVSAESTVTEVFTVWADTPAEAAALVELNRAGDPDDATDPAVRAVLSVVVAEPEVFECASCQDSGVIVERYNAGDGLTTNVDPCTCAAGERFAAERMAGR
jgi:hypothetical protein